jgi:hypothetical protein
VLPPAGVAWRGVAPISGRLMLMVSTIDTTFWQHQDGEAAMPFAGNRAPVNDKIIATARKALEALDLPELSRHRVELRRIVNGTRKSVDPEWWRRVRRIIDKKKLDAINTTKAKPN